MGQNTVFGYKKGSKSDLDIGSKSATLELYMNIFTTFFPRWSEHRKPEGGEYLGSPKVNQENIAGTRKNEGSPESFWVLL